MIPNSNGSPLTHNDTLEDTELAILPSCSSQSFRNFPEIQLHSCCCCCANIPPQSSLTPQQTKLVELDCCNIFFSTSFKKYRRTGSEREFQDTYLGSQTKSTRVLAK